MTENLGFSHFLENTDAVGCFVILILMLMSVATWYLIILKGWQLRSISLRSRGFLRRFRSIASIDAANKSIARDLPDEPFGRLALACRNACRQLSKPRGLGAVELTSADDFLAAALSHAVAAELARLEEGLVILSSVASTAPFVGLFGTVWGIYHALIAIGATGQASLDQVAGAVGEALIMTGCGLAVAIPAVLGYNALASSIRKIIGNLESFGHELFVLFTTGSFHPPEDAADVEEAERTFEIEMTEQADGL